MLIDACPVCGADALVYQCHDLYFVECPTCEAADSLSRWCEDHTDLPLLAAHSVEQAIQDWADMCSAYYAFFVYRSDPD